MVNDENKELKRKADEDKAEYDKTYNDLVNDFRTQEADTNDLKDMFATYMKLNSTQKQKMMGILDAEDCYLTALLTKLVDDPEGLDETMEKIKEKSQAVSVPNTTTEGTVGQPEKVTEKLAETKDTNENATIEHDTNEDMDVIALSKKALQEIIKLASLKEMPVDDEMAEKFTIRIPTSTGKQTVSGSYGNGARIMKVIFQAITYLSLLYCKQEEGNTKIELWKTFEIHGVYQWWRKWIQGLSTRNVTENRMKSECMAMGIFYALCGTLDPKLTCSISKTQANLLLTHEMALRKGQDITKDSFGEPDRKKTVIEGFYSMWEKANYSEHKFLLGTGIISRLGGKITELVKEDNEMVTDIITRIAFLKKRKSDATTTSGKRIKVGNEKDEEDEEDDQSNDES
jgi:hypothetical protein